jgi:hypothetical protein
MQDEGIYDGTLARGVNRRQFIGTVGMRAPERLSVLMELSSQVRQPLRVRSPAASRNSRRRLGRADVQVSILGVRRASPGDFETRMRSSNLFMRHWMPG